MSGGCQECLVQKEGPKATTRLCGINHEDRLSTCWVWEEAGPCFCYSWSIVAMKLFVSRVSSEPASLFTPLSPLGSQSSVPYSNSRMNDIKEIPQDRN